MIMRTINRFGKHIVLNRSQMIHSRSIIYFSDNRDLMASIYDINSENVKTYMNGNYTIEKQDMDKYIEISEKSVEKQKAREHNKIKVYDYYALSLISYGMIPGIVGLNIMDFEPFIAGISIPVSYLCYIGGNWFSTIATDPMSLEKSKEINTMLKQQQKLDDL